MLDTPAKRTLWFHIIPLLDEDDQEYTKRRLFLFTGRDEEVVLVADGGLGGGGGIGEDETDETYYEDQRENQRDNNADIDPRVREALRNIRRKKWENHSNGKSFGKAKIEISL